MGHGDGHKLRKNTDCEGDALSRAVLKTSIIRTKNWLNWGYLPISYLLSGTVLVAVEKQKVVTLLLLLWLTICGGEENHPQRLQFKVELHKCLKSTK